MNEEQRQAIIKLQATLTKISVKANVFFNVAQYVSMGLVREYGTTIDNKTNWVLTAKANKILSIQL
jgi:hypothetical protein